MALQDGRIDVMNRQAIRKKWKALAGLALLFVFANQADAQIQVDLKLDRPLYVLHEPVTGTLTIINRAGRDLVFGESGGLSWLDFTVTDGKGNLITPFQGMPKETSIVLQSGQTYEHKVHINKYYPMGQVGIYRVKASVNFPQIRRVFQSPQQSVQITEGQPLWSQIVGVPQGHPRAGTYREYSLMTYYHGARNKALYFRMKDSDSGLIYKTYPLGDYMTLRPPAHAIDRENQLHVLHMSAPQKYTYTVIDIDGNPLFQREYVERNTNRPELVSTDFGDVSVQGGLTMEEASKSYEETQFRLLSERPPGIPVF